MEKLKMQSPNLSQENIAKIRDLFPGCVTEARDEASGQSRLAVDFDQLRQELSEHIVEGPQERYQLNWPGKREALALTNVPITKSLRPARSESVDFDNTKNLFIEGNNLDALKMLQETYLGQVKMIYIDPPYNTGKDFIYSDNFSRGLEEYNQKLGAVDEDGNTLFSGENWQQNLSTGGRFHSDWLSMLYPLLRLSKNLLRKDGVIFISIGDHEIHNLRKLCDEVFGSDNFCAQFVWNTEGNTDNQYEIKVNHEYVLAYYRDSSYSDSAIGRVIDPNTPEDSNLRKGYADNNINKNNPENPPAIVELPVGFPSSEESLFYPAKKLDEEFFRITGEEKFISDRVKEKYEIEKLSGLPVKLDDMVVDNFRLTQPCRIFVGMANRNKLQEFINNGCNEVLEDDLPIRFYINANAAVRYRKKNDRPRNILSVFRNMGTTEKTKTYLRKMGIFYNYPKPLELIQYLVSIGCEREGLVLDFFAGSSTTAEAVFRQNKADGTNRRFALVQLAEPLDPSKKEQKEAFEFCKEHGIKPNLAEISKARIRRSASAIEAPLAQDVGFRVLKIDTSNMKDVYYRPDKLKQSNLLDMVDNVKEGRSSEDLLFQVLVDWGVDLTLPIRRETVQGRTVFFVDDNALVACFESTVTEDLVKELVSHQPLRVVFRDNGFVSDAVKINVEQIFRQLSPTTEVKSI
ncbi:site-specific DNA-methyltransferase [Brucella rhizosphaerae]|uniref:site-specific DNA-methyltransferase n=1 Tax=Brucella rhizosphaerae TaxID=571254 RepID=UPI0004663186|nr:site-specific DNA-methyltransferase [Brucella rhizosphaerae]